MSFPFPKRPHVTIFATDFSEYTVGVEPPDWEKVTRPADFTALISTDAPAPTLSGKQMKLVRTPASLQNIVWNRVGLVGDVEVLFRAHKAENVTNDNSALMGAGARCVLPTNNTGSTLTIASTMLLEGHEGWLGKWVNGAQTGVTNYNGVHVGTGFGNWWWQRQRFVGNSFWMKHWLHGTAEPSTWGATADMGTGIPAEGWVGAFVNNFNDAWVDYFAVSVGSPGFPPDTIPLPV